MSQMTSNPDNSPNQKEYHTPKFRKFGSVSDLTLTTAAPSSNPSDGGFPFPNAYTS